MTEETTPPIVNRPTSVKYPHIQDGLKYKSATWYYQNVPSYREKVIQWTKECIYRRRAEDKEGFNEKQRDYIRNKYQTDEAYRERQKTRARERYQKKKALALDTQLTQAVEALSINS